MDSNEFKLKRQIKLDVDKVPSNSLESIADFVKDILKFSNTTKRNKEVISLYGCMKIHLDDDSIDKAMKQSREETVTDLEKRVTNWNI